MGFLVILPFAALTGFVIVRMHRWLCRGTFGPEWRRRFFGLSAAGVALGAWLVFFCQYNVAQMRIESFPIPTAIWSRENPDKRDEPQVRHVLPVAIRAGATVTNFLCAVVFCLAPLALAAFIKENRGQKDFAGPGG